MSDWRSKQRNGGSLNTEEMLDAENQRRTEGLADRVSLLKGIALDIEDISKESNRYVGSMGGDFNSSEGLLSGSMHRLSNMVGSGKNNRKLMCYIIVPLREALMAQWIANSAWDLHDSPGAPSQTPWPDKGLKA
ncbi:Bet1-like protein [Plakobranchus ocellatus]|uniref:Bet1-like protein n=1 Tax=Plakobranchus ocellatus TaxID=259542 RepID=A0AAV3ZH62_9GAST|nr:Bet1-like protein [Plakobranchus ocellatus]